MHVFICCSFLYFDVFFELKKYIQCDSGNWLKPCENNDYIKKQ